MTIGMTRVREEAGLTKMRLATLANVHPSRISAIELQRALPLTHGAEMIRICRAFRELGYEVDAAALLEPVEDGNEAASA